MGARGVQTLDANFDKSFVTPVWNFVVVSPGTISGIMHFYSTELSARSSITTRRINYDPAREADLGHVLLV